MIKILFSILIIFLGILIVAISIFSKDTNIDRCWNENKDIYKKYIKYQTLSDVLSGILFVIIGFMYLFNILSGENVGLISTVLVLANRIVELIISNKYKM
ncbi:hypothetical protein [Clostridium folliculivorans]|uniref:DUF3784 domain-containing protein n=1 Tax=Clostridium folliculivorans TaxID=2886038 RepID=A0A9W6DA13_9CLOT|nr:hypothetical protein [Clostridium folliculivorans]GKU24915.1 hypothetical protein CFOLD11_17410 [Clostridium folliculivorans]GKU31013.1 hypothetical protein CFB3_31200 [Clostridium folliculivorans]